MTKQIQLEEKIHNFLDTKFQKYPEVEQEADRIMREIGMR
jgi:hypothetical protein